MALAVVRSLRSPSRLATPQETEEFEQELVDQYALAMAASGTSDHHVAQHRAVLFEFIRFLGRPVWTTEPSDAEPQTAPANAGEPAIRPAQRQAGHQLVLFSHQRDLVAHGRAGLPLPADPVLANELYQRARDYGTSAAGAGGRPPTPATACGLPAPMANQLGRWFAVMKHGSSTAPRRRARSQTTIGVHLRWALPTLRAWATAGHTTLREITRAGVQAALPPSGNPVPPPGRA